MTKSNSNKIVELYPEMFTFTMRGYEHNIFEKGYNKALAYIHKHIKWTRSIDYIQQTNPYKYEFAIGDGWFKIVYELVADIKVNDLKKGDWVTKVTQCNIITTISQLFPIPKFEWVIQIIFNSRHFFLIDV